MNIAEVCLNSSLGGLELYFYWCCEFFNTSNHKLSAVTVPESRLQQLLMQNQIEPILISKKGFGGGLRAAFQLARLFVDKQIDVVHVHFAKDLPIVALAKLWSQRKVLLIHTRQMEMPGSKKDLYHRFVYSQVDHMVCVTEKLRKDVLERVPLPSKKVSRLYYGVPQPIQDNKRQTSFLAQFPSTRPKVAMFSRLEKSKGQWRLLQVLIQLKKQGFEFQIYFFGHFMGGDGYEEEMKKEIQRANLQDYIYWCGFQKNPSELMACFDVVALPSDQETFGLVLIEAMAAGTAIIGTNTGGVPEIIEDGVNGFTFSPDDIDGFGKKLKILLENKELRKQFIEAGFKKYQEFFRAQEHFKNLEKLFTKLQQD